MVDLTNPNPDPAKAGQPFSVTASNGSPLYTFRWGIGEGEATEITQEDPLLEINIDDDAAGKAVHVKVTDGNGARDADAYQIVA